MAGQSVLKPTPLGMLCKSAGTARWLQYVAVAIAGTGLLALSAKVQVPFWPVPQTMQTFVVLMIGALCGWRLGTATILLYLAEGAMGLPVFAGTPVKGTGLAYMMGPTGGYLFGFVLAALITGWLIERGWNRTILRSGVAVFLGTLAIYLPGLAWLSGLIGLDKAVTFGVLPFLLGDAVKLVLAACLISLCWKMAMKNTQ